MRLFQLVRDVDPTGISGIGHVADGVEFDSGWCVVAWGGPHPTVTVHLSMATVEAIHGHIGKTRILFRLVDELLVQAQKQSNDLATALDVAREQLGEITAVVGRTGQPSPACEVRRVVAERDELRRRLQVFADAAAEALRPAAAYADATRLQEAITLARSPIPSPERKVSAG